MFEHSHLVRLAIVAIVAAVGSMLFPRSAVFAAPAMAIYRGELAGANGATSKVELRLKADGTLSMMTDHRNNRAPVTEEGRWNPISVEQIEVTLERKDGVAVEPRALHFVKEGDALKLTAESAAQLGARSLQLQRHMNRQTASAAATLPLLGTIKAAGIWRWESLVTGTGKISVEQPERYTLELQGDGKAAVRADCNRGPAAYKLEGRAIAIKLGRMPRTACATGSMADRYLKALEAAVGQRIRGDTLFLDLPGEGGSMIFARAR